MPKTEYIAIDDLPKSIRGQKTIPEEWVKMIQVIPVEHGLKIADLKYSTVQGRILNLTKAKILNGKFKVIQRTITTAQGKEKSVYVIHNK